MPKTQFYQFLFLITSAILFGLLTLLNLADASGAPPSNKPSISALPSFSNQLISTPVTTFYLPILFSDPSSGGLKIKIDLPSSNIYQIDENIYTIITVTSPEGVDQVVWGVFTKNLNPLTGGLHHCDGTPNCQVSVTFSIPITGEFLLGVDTIDTTGKLARWSHTFYIE